MNIKQLKKELQEYTKFLKQNDYICKPPKNLMTGYLGEYIIEKNKI